MRYTKEQFLNGAVPVDSVLFFPYRARDGASPGRLQTTAIRDWEVYRSNRGDLVLYGIREDSTDKNTIHRNYRVDRIPADAVITTLERI